MAAEAKARCAGAARAWRIRVGRREAAMASMGWCGWGVGRIDGGVVVVVPVEIGRRTAEVIP